MATTRIPIGSTFRISVADARSPAGGYASKHYVNGEEMDASYGDGCWVSGWTAAEATFDPGRYTYEAWLTKLDADGAVEVRELVETGTLDMFEPSSASDEAQPQSFAERLLAECEKTLIETADSAAASMSVGGQSFSFETRNELLSFRNRVARQVAGERRRARGRVSDGVVFL